MRQIERRIPCKYFVLLGVAMGFFLAFIANEIGFIVKNQEAYRVFRNHPEIVSSLKINEPTFSLKK